jgi:hypothetical protein
MKHVVMLRSLRNHCVQRHNQGETDARTPPTVGHGSTPLQVLMLFASTLEVFVQSD